MCSDMGTTLNVSVQVKSNKINELPEVMQKQEFAFPICLLYDCKLAVSMTNHIQQDKFLTVRTDQPERDK